MRANNYVLRTLGAVAALAALLALPGAARAPAPAGPMVMVVPGPAANDAPAEVRLLRHASAGSDPSDSTDLAVLDGGILYQRGTGRTLLIAVDSVSATSFVVRVGANGAIDSTFGGGTGFVEIDGVPAWGAAVATGDDDRITLAVARPGAASSMLHRLERDGAPDASFGDRGSLTLPDGVFASAILVGADGATTIGAWSAKPGPQSWRILRTDRAGRVDSAAADTIPAGRGVESGIERFRLLPDGRIAASAWCSSAGGSVRTRELTLPAASIATTADAAPAPAGLLPIR